MSERRPALWFVAAGLAIILMMVAGTLVEEHQQSEEMKACVAAGKSWVRDFGDYYECVEER